MQKIISKEFFNIYCDESCHLLNDDSNVMALGAIWAPINSTKEIAERIREIKESHNLSRKFEIKWTKVSLAKFEFYKSLVDYFFDDDDLHYRVVIIPDKSILNHKEWNQTHDDFYYKMYFELLKVILKPSAQYRIYLDIKDTKSNQKIHNLHEILSRNMLNSDKDIIEFIQNVRSHEVEQIQLADLLTGAVTYFNRGLENNKAKLKLIDRIHMRSRYILNKSTLLREEKFNILYWQPRNQRY